MSRNFELLQRVGKEQSLFQAGAGVEAAPKVSRPAPTTEPRLKMEGKELEEVTKLVQRVFLLPGSEAPRTVVFAAPESGNGCTWISARAAELLASQVAGSVCLVDANLRNPGLHNHFAVENHRGLADALRQTGSVREFIQPLLSSNLSLISCGSSPEASQTLVSSERMRLLITELRSEFDYVLVDTPAINACPDAVALGAIADGVVIVLKANSSRRETARRIVRELEQAKAKPLGVVLNQRTFPIPDSIYSKL